MSVWYRRIDCRNICLPPPPPPPPDGRTLNRRFAFFFANLHCMILRRDRRTRPCPPTATVATVYYSSSSTFSRMVRVSCSIALIAQGHESALTQSLFFSCWRAHMCISTSLHPAFFRRARIVLAHNDDAGFAKHARFDDARRVVPEN